MHCWWRATEWHASCIVCSGIAAHAISISCIRLCRVLGFLVYTVFFRVPHKVRVLRVLSKEIGVNTLPFPFVLSIFQENDHWENISHHCGNVVEHHPVESNTFSPKTNCWSKVQCCPVTMVSRQRLWQLLQRKMALSVLWKIDHSTLIPLVD
jgi:hypothetical protein